MDMEMGRCNESLLNAQCESAQQSYSYEYVQQINSHLPAVLYGYEYSICINEYNCNVANPVMRAISPGVPSRLGKQTGCARLLYSIGGLTWSRAMSLLMRKGSYCAFAMIRVTWCVLTMPSGSESLR